MRSVPAVNRTPNVETVTCPRYRLTMSKTRQQGTGNWTKFNWKKTSAQLNQIKSSLYSSYYAEACNEWRGPSQRLGAWATQLRRNVATVTSRWRHCVDLTGPGIEPRTSRTNSVRGATGAQLIVCLNMLV